MSFQSTLKLDSKFFDPLERKKSFSSAAYEAARDFRADLKQKMEDSVPTGNIVSIGRNTGFETRFQRSKRGQRPAIQTRKLISSINSKRISELSASVSIDIFYAAPLQFTADRILMSELDVKEAEAKFNALLQRKLLDLF